jgi:hypothetical protein
MSFETAFETLIETRNAGPLLKWIMSEEFIKDIPLK